jgi:hypothetical protein
MKSFAALVLVAGLGFLGVSSPVSATQQSGKASIESATTGNGCYYLAGIGYRCR